MTADDGQHSGWGADSKTQLTGRLTRSLPNFEQRITGMDGLATEFKSVRGLEIGETRVGGQANCLVIVSHPLCLIDAVPAESP